MSPATKAVLARVRLMVPPMLSKFHKGQLGRVGVIGGSQDYTGAPYFSAMASARLGCDMSHVICTPAAAAVVKTYSPNLMVHPLMRQAETEDGVQEPDQGQIDKQAAAVCRRIVDQLLPRLHVLVIGPGLGRDPLMQATAARVITAARERGLPLVLDADALQLVQQDPGLVRGYALAVLTPNVVEFGRLEKALLGDGGGDGDGGGGGENDNLPDKGVPAGKSGARAARLARVLGGVTIVQKGAVDIIATDYDTSGPAAAAAAADDDNVDVDAKGGHTDLPNPLVSDLPGGRKRSGGQGDTLTGSIATFLGWRKAYLDGIWDVTQGGRAPRLAEQTLVPLAAFGGSALTRECSRLAFAKKGRSLQASDLTDEVYPSFLNLFGTDGQEEEEDEHEDGGPRL
ncbi:carbohydrate kinase-like protein [Niveomyces insectorum RCEF 264]|uniref:ATP-dependent (S)-NAD(P)H-hydrate dehydratase n=1 Tax=Niveomyces insectorum RCEF 264 TaxID=1081102 RepID=A0A167Z5N4_9HYPO|nr:carbohydrate kinase-like protein [Niveomyces insectorum RCEF 264]